jgi:DNA replication ATP-dependent helicase Dna2
MPSFKKKSISLSIRNDCSRQFRLSLYTDTERTASGMPPAQKARAGVGLVGAAGDEWQDKKVSEVELIFGVANVICAPKPPGKMRPASTPLDSVIGMLKEHQFVVEASFEMPTIFRHTFKLNGLTDKPGQPLEFSKLIPDIIQVLPSLRADPTSCSVGVAPDGELVELSATDSRLQLRVIDIKLASEPGANYFAEVVYYSMVLAAWLTEHGLNDQFVVTGNGAVWPGSYEKSALALKHDEKLSGTPISVQELIAAMGQDLEEAEFSVYVPRLRRLLLDQLPNILGKEWDELPWHPSVRCQSCEFLGYPWKDKYGKPTEDKLHCWQVAKKGDMISRVAGLSRGAAGALPPSVANVTALSALRPSDPVFDRHPGLRAKRSVLPARAMALVSGVTSAIPGSGSSATMPKWSDLKVFMTLDYDPSSAITAVMSMRASWREPLPFGSVAKAEEKRWGDKASGQIVKIVPARTIKDEEREFLAFLRQLKAIFQWVEDDDKARTTASLTPDDVRSSTYQIYLWDDAQYRHLTRLMGRHLVAISRDPALRGLAWLFPPPEVLPHPEDATLKSPISLVNTAVDNHLAVPVPHHYTLYEVAQHYLPTSASVSPPFVRELYREPLTNLIPAERIHEYWEHKPSWLTVQSALVESSVNKTYALALITSQLQHDPGIQLARSAAPTLSIQRTHIKNASPETLLWHQFTQLNVALQGVESQLAYALPPTERESRFRAAHLVRELSGGREYTAALAQINANCHTRLRSAPDLVIYVLSPHSRDVKLEPGDFNVALSPRDEDLFLNKNVGHRLAHAPTYVPADLFRTIEGARLTAVTVEAIDREHLLIALRLDPKNRIRQMERCGDAIFSTCAMLDPVYRDFLTKKVRLTLEGMGKPKGYAGNPRLMIALGAPAAAVASAGKPATPAHDFLYHPDLTYRQMVARPTTALQAALVKEGLNLNSSQWNAWESALSRRLTVIWGPPGTGKSETLRAIVRGAVLHAQDSVQPSSLRILITANTYTAVDNVLLKLERHFHACGTSVQLYRVQHHSRPVDAALASHPSLINVLLDKAAPGKDALALRTLLSDLSDAATPRTEVVIVGAPTQQLHNLAYAGEKSDAAGHAKKSWFDLVLLDEASQVDVATSALVFTKLAKDGACVLAGDDLQLPPIHQADAPEGLGPLVGSIYTFMTDPDSFKVPRASLDVNYRSNGTIVEFTKLAGYSSALTAHSPTMTLHVSGGLPVTAPADWPATLAFGPEWAELLRADRPVACFIYDDTASGQSNDFEAQVVASLLRTLHRRLAEPLHRTGGTAPPLLYSVDRFWNQGVGVVAPHRAQGSKIVDTLGRAFTGTGTNPEMIRDAVDTVERFQGQERDVIIASYGLGDPDLIASEDEFLYDLNRFNVLASRATVKLVVLMTRSLLDHLSNDQDVVRASRLLKRYAESYCRNDRPMILTCLDASGAPVGVTGRLRDR